MDGAAAPAFELAISRALVAEGVAVIAGPPSACGAGCARVRVQQLDPSAYQVEVARLQDRREARLSLPAEASSFERAHSLALRARALLDDLPDEARRPLRKKSVPAAAQAPAPAAPLAGPILPPVAPVSEPPARSAPPLVAPESKPAISPQALEPVANSPLPGPTRWLRIAVGSGVTAGAGRDDDLLAGGPSLWARAALGRLPFLTRGHGEGGALPGTTPARRTGRIGCAPRASDTARRRWRRAVASRGFRRQRGRLGAPRRAARRGGGTPTLAHLHARSPCSCGAAPQPRHRNRHGRAFSSSDRFHRDHAGRGVRSSLNRCNRSPAAGVLWPEVHPGGTL